MKEFRSTSNFERGFVEPNPKHYMTLMDFREDFNRIVETIDFYIKVNALIYVRPISSVKKLETIEVALWQKYSNVKELGCLSFKGKLIIPKTLEKYNKFYVRVEVDNKCFRFLILRKRKFKQLKYHNIIGSHFFVKLYLE